MRINPAALTAIRERSGLSQNELARRSGVDQSHISALERGEANPDVRPATATALARGLKVALDALLADPDAESVTS